MWETFFQLQTLPSDAPSAIILDGRRGLSGFFIWISRTLVFCSLNRNSLGSRIRYLAYFSELMISVFRVRRCSLAWYWVCAIMRMSLPLHFVKDRLKSCLNSHEDRPTFWLLIMSLYLLGSFHS